jgi:transposase
MDVNPSYSLVTLPPQQGTLVPVATAIANHSDCQDDTQPDPLWLAFCKLALLFLLVLRRWRQQIVELRRQANFWQAQHQRARQREANLAEQIQLLQGEIRELKRRLFGRKSETSSSTRPTASSQTQNQQHRPRGQQRGSKGHGRRNHDHLPTTHEHCTLPDEEKCCPDCGQAYEEIPGCAEGDILEIDVRAHRRRYHRQRYRRCCTCPGQPQVISAPPPDKLIAKSSIGISLWVLILQRKFAFFQPLHRVLAELRSYDLHLAAGTVTDGLHKLVPLFEPLYQLLILHNRAAGHWHADETRWFVFIKHPGKANFVWMLWVFAAAESVVFVLDPTRSHDVPEQHFGADAAGILNVDRYSAYKAMAQVKAGQILLSFCWAHVRRDFLEVLTGWSELADWAWSWLDAIAALYHDNERRLAVREDASAFAQADEQLRQGVEQLRLRCDQELAPSTLRQPQRKVLTSLQEHWPGLTLFVDHPEVPMDNNRAERLERGPVVGRKNFYGSGALWSGRLAAMLFSLFQTVQLWGLDVSKWLTTYLTACAQAKGQPPPDPQRYLPWNMTPEERARMGGAPTNRLEAEPPHAATAS